MSARLQEIVRKRRLLVALAREQRLQLAAEAVVCQRTLGYADMAWRGYRRLKSNPIIAAIGGTALLALGPGKLLRKGYRGAMFLVGLLRVFKLVKTLR